ncbi:MAG: hypothetical protein MJE66_14675 [Proteobacteria bacterium]|nr:hypothetical protein [Pseudomonadota bacterium]
MLPEQGRIITTSDGSISEAEVLEHGRRMNRDPRIEPGFSELLDLSNLESGDISLGGIKAVVELERGADRIERSRLAIVAPRDVAFGIGRM